MAHGDRVTVRQIHLSSASIKSFSLTVELKPKIPDNVRDIMNFTAVGTRQSFTKDIHSIHLLLRLKMTIVSPRTSADRSVQVQKTTYAHSFKQRGRNIVWHALVVDDGRKWEAG